MSNKFTHVVNTGQCYMVVHMDSTGAHNPKQNFRTQSNGGRLEDRIYSSLLDEIRLGRYGLGERLPSENQLASELGVSRPVIRAALAKLRNDGLVVSRHGAGSFVSGAEQSDSTFGPLSSIDDIGRYFEYRKLIETETAERAAARSDGAPFLQLRRSVELLGDRLDEGTSSVDVDFEFHMLIADLSDNRFLVESLLLLRPHWFFIGKFVRSLANTAYGKGKRSIFDEHSRILSAIEEGNRAAARDAMTEHVLNSERRVFKGAET